MGSCRNMPESYRASKYLIVRASLEGSICRRSHQKLRRQAFFNWRLKGSQGCHAAASIVNEDWRRRYYDINSKW